MARRLGGMYGVDYLGRHMIALGMHDMLSRVVLLHQTERIDTHFKLDSGKVRTLILDALHKLGSEVQTRRWRRSRMLLGHRVDGLVLLGITLVIGNIGRQRHMARSMNGLVKRARLARCGVGALRLKANQAATTAVNDVIGNLGR